MKTTIQFYLNLFLCCLWAISCNPGGMETEYQVTSGHWGHLNNIGLTNPSPMYLSHIKKDEVYRICLAKYMIQNYPGIQAEIRAGINIWAHYIGREIKVEIVEADLPMPEQEDDPDKLTEKYYPLCPSNIHMVMGFSPLEGDAIGQTSNSYSYFLKNGRRDVTRFKRYLFLKVPTQNADEEDNQEDEEDKNSWKSLAQVKGKELNDQEILDLMKSRQESFTRLIDHENLTLKVITHEFGHVWGLCDQYEDGTDNCDKKFALLDKDGEVVSHQDAMMGSSSITVKLSLSDDDIEGIRKIAERPGFSNGWPGSAIFRKIEVQEVAKEKAVSVAKIKSATYKDMTVSLQMLLSVASRITLSVRLFDTNTQSWLEFDDINYDRPGTTNYTLNLNLGRYVGPEKVQIILKYQDESKKEEKLVLESAIKIINKTTGITPGKDEE